MAVIGWGLPPAIPEVADSGIRSSYAFDEDDVLTALALSNPKRLDLDPRQYQWGALHLELVLFSLEAAELAGYFDHGWRRAYYEMIPGEFERVYAVGRMMAVAGALGSIAAIFFLALEYMGKGAAFWAAALVAISPEHLLASAQVRVDLTMTALVIVAAWLAVRAQRSGRPSRFLWLGAAAGAAMAAKYTAVFLMVPLMAAAWGSRRFGARLGGAAALGAAAGFVLAQPYLLIRPRQIAQQVFSVVQTSQAIPDTYRIPTPDLLATQAVYLVRFLIGAPAALLAAAGVVILLRRRTAADWMALSLLAGGVVSFVPLLWPMLRYQLPLLPLLALAGGVALERLRSFPRIATGILALILPLAASIDQFHFMRAPHPANRMLAVILQQVPRGSPIARPMVELPPLDRKVYPVDGNPLLEDLGSKPPAWVLLTDLPITQYPVTTTSLLRTQYDRLADFALRPLFPWATLGAGNTPHDWKYSHPTMALYRRRTP